MNAVETILGIFLTGSTAGSHVDTTTFVPDWFTHVLSRFHLRQRHEFEWNDSTLVRNIVDRAMQRFENRTKSAIFLDVFEAQDLQSIMEKLHEPLHVSSRRL
jgi:hypothetical protein